MYVAKIDEKEAMYLKERKEGHMEGFRGRKGKRKCHNYNLQ